MSPDGFKLYESSASPNSRRVRIFLAEKGRAIAGPHAYEQIPGLVERGRQRIADFYADLEARLGEAPYVAGDRFSAADITAVVTVDFATKALELAIPGANGATRRWYDAVAARTSFAA